MRETSPLESPPDLDQVPILADIEDDRSEPRGPSGRRSSVGRVPVSVSRPRGAAT